MTRQPISRSFRFLTPAFAHGAYQSRQHNLPELRAPSLRGQLRWWWRALGYGIGDEIFGTASGEAGTASRVQVRLEAPLPELVRENVQLLLHKNQGSKNALDARANSYTARIIPVRGGVSEDVLKKLSDSLDAWLLMGAIGQRANRAAGSPWPEESACATPAAYLTRCRSLLSSSIVKISLLHQQSKNFEEIRRLAGNFSSNSPGAVFGSAQPRKSSSLKLRAVHLDGAYGIAALWCPKDTTSDTPANLRKAINEMKDFTQKAYLGELLEKALPDLLGPSDPLEDLLAPPFSYDSFRLYKNQIAKWQAAGEVELIARFRERTASDQFSNLRKEPWYPGNR